MKNYPYNTGRTVTINLDTLGNADLWQVFQILTDNTGHIWEGDENPDASPSADTDAATEIFLHVAETADDRADGADISQRNWLLGIKDEYLDIFGNDGPANVTGSAAPEEPATITRVALSGLEYTEENIERADTVAESNGCPVLLFADGKARELRVTGTAAAIEDFFAYCREAAAAPEEEPAPAANPLRDDPDYRSWEDALVWLDQMPRHNKGDYDPWKIVEEAARIHSTGAGENNLFVAGRIYGMACALASICPVERADADWWLGYIEDYAEANYENGSRVEI